MIIGSAVKIQATVSLVSPDSVTLKIKDPKGTVKLLAGVMVLATGKWEYTWQSVDADLPGEYTAIVSAVSGGYTSKEKTTFELNQQ